MKTNLLKVIAIFIFAVFAMNVNAGNCIASDKGPLETYSLVKINIVSNSDIMRIQQNDITLEHYSGSLREGIEVVLNLEEIYRLKNTGINYEVLIQNMDEYYANRKAPSITEMQRSFNISSADNVSGFSYGSMGGFYTYAEIVQKLDSMRLRYPNLISVKQSIGLSVESRNIWAVKISDNPDFNESSTEPAIYFDALHHAREPESMACMMYYMYWLLENYGTDPEATYLMNNREIYFVPVVNPDGYVYNQSTNPNGGGNWRKNRKNNGSCYGVDLNRNYNYGWGNDNGSSNDPCSETFRGLSAASEPETQAIKSFALQIQPKTSFTMHSFAGRYLNPYGYTDTAVSYEIYSEFSSDFAASNNYTYGTVFEMLEYYSSGGTRDFLHTTGTYAWTPEVGGSGFWPAQSEIIPVASENLYGMKYLTWVGGAYADFVNYKIAGNGYVQKNDTLNLQLALKNRGLSLSSKNVTVNITSNYPGIVALNSSVNYDSIQARQFKDNNSNPFKFIIPSTAVYMDEMKFFVSVKQEGVQTSLDTIKINVGKAIVLFSDNAENGISKWVRAGTGTQWDTTFIDPNDGLKNFADSRYGNSKNNSNNTFTLKDTINLIGANNPRIEFTAKWAEEVTFDYTRIQISTNFGTTWINLPGRYTTTVSGQPSYTAIKHWVFEQINLNSYIGQRLKIRFNLITDNGVPGDGFYFDNFRVVNYKDVGTGIVQTSTSIPNEFKLYQNYPNPFNPTTNLEFGIKDLGFVTLKIFDVTGKEIASLVNSDLSPGKYKYEFDGSHLSSGIYFYTLKAGNFVSTKQMVLLK